MSMTTRSTIRLRQYCLLRSAISHFSSLCWAGSLWCTAIGRGAAGSLPQFAWRVSSARQGVTIPSRTWKFDSKFRSIFGVATLLAGLCVFSTNVALTQTAAQISAAKDILAKVARSELPSKAAQLVVDAPAKQKAAVASAVGQAVAAIHPDSASAAVAAIASKVPAAAPAAAAGAAGKLPGSAPAIAVAAASVPGVAADDVRIAVTAAVPRQRAQIESALSRAKVSSSAVPATPDTSVPLAQVQAPQQPVANPPPVAEAAPRSEPSKDAVDIPIIEIPKPIARPNEISISGDFLYGQGTVTLPFAFSLAKGDPAGFGPFVKVGSPDRKSDYIGATISYSFGQAWYIDASYAHGNSSGDFALPETLFGQGPSSSFKIDDDWYQAYLRYTFPGLRGTRLSAYVRAGASYVKADLSDISVFFNYEQTDKIFSETLGLVVGTLCTRATASNFFCNWKERGFTGTASRILRKSWAARHDPPLRLTMTFMAESADQLSAWNTIWDIPGCSNFLRMPVWRSNIQKLFIRARAPLLMAVIVNCSGDHTPRPVCATHFRHFMGVSL